MRAALDARHVWGVVSGQIQPPAATAPQLEQERWENANNVARALIISGLDEVLVPDVAFLTKAEDIWTQLAQTYDVKNVLTLCAVRSELFTLRMHDGDKVAAFVGKFRQLRATLISLGFLMPELDAVVQLLTSLPPSYQSFVTSYGATLRDAGKAATAGQPVMISFADVVGALLQEDQSRNTSHSNSGRTKTDKVLSTSKFRPKGRGKLPAAGSSKDSQSGQVKRTGACNWCGTLGHWERECRKKKAGEPKKAEKTPQAHSVSKPSKASTSGKPPVVMTVCLSTASRVDDAWYLDSGATTHVCHNKTLMSNFVSLHTAERVLLGDELTRTGLKILGRGSCYFQLSDGKLLRIDNVLYVPDMAKHLLSVSQLMQLKRFQLTFTFDGCMLTTSGPSPSLVAKGLLEHDLHRLDMFCVPAKSVRVAERSQTALAQLWHARLGHANKDKLIKMSNLDCYREPLPKCFKDLPLCDSCIVAKQKELPFPTTVATRTTSVLDLVHADISGKIHVPSLGGSLYYLTLTDDFSRYSWTFPMKRKSDTFAYFQEWLTMVQRQTGCFLRCLRSDNGTEFVNGPFDEYLSKQGITRQLSIPYTQQQNVLLSAETKLCSA